MVEVQTLKTEMSELCSNLKSCVVAVENIKTKDSHLSSQSGVCVSAVSYGCAGNPDGQIIGSLFGTMSL